MKFLIFAVKAESLFISPDMVVQSMAEYERQQALIDLYSKLSVAEAEIADGAEGEDFLRVAGELRGLVHGRL